MYLQMGRETMKKVRRNDLLNTYCIIVVIVIVVELIDVSFSKSTHKAAVLLLCEYTTDVWVAITWFVLSKTKVFPSLVNVAIRHVHALTEAV